jgi:hypothetical protein
VKNRAIAVSIAASRNSRELHKFGCSETCKTVVGHFEDNELFRHEESKMEKDSSINGSASKVDPTVSILEAVPTKTSDASHQIADDGFGHGNGQERRGIPAWVRFRKYMRDPFAEFMGVFTLIIFGDGVVAQVVLSKGTRGDYQSINWG